MKKILFVFVIILFFVNAKAQDTAVLERFNMQSEESIKSAFELILAEAKNEFSYRGMDRLHGNRYTFQYFDESTRGTGDPRFIEFYVGKRNTGNIDLEIEGEDLYSLAMVSGKFLDFAGFWIKYINPNITLEELVKNSDEFTYELNGKTRTIRLLKQFGDNVWLLRNY